jgi:hypothetical protein
MLLMWHGLAPGVIYHLFIYFISFSYGLRYRHIIYPFRSSQRAHRNGESKLSFEVFYDDVIYKPLDQLLSTVPFSTYIGVPPQQKLETPTVGVLYCGTVNLYQSCVGFGWLAQETT